MDVRKLSRKHRTLDCDLDETSYQSSAPLSSSSSASKHQHQHQHQHHHPQQQQQQQQQQQTWPNQQAQQPIAPNTHQNPSTDSNQPVAHYHNPSSHTNTDVLRNVNDLDDDQYYADDPHLSNTTQNQPHRLSKLTLSSSLHQLTDSKFLNNNNNNNNNNNANNNIIESTYYSSNTQQPNHVHPIHNTTTKTANTTNADPKYKTNNKYSAMQCSTNTTTNNTNTPTTTTTTSNKHPHLNKRQREANLDTVHVVVGNEACDLDSAVSCLLMFHIISKMSDEINGKDKTRTLYIPLLNTTRDMLDSKSEVLWFLQKTLNIDKSFLTCKDDIDWSEIKKNGIEVLVTLVDHNYNEDFKDIGRIVEIIDHHEVQNSQWLMENHPGIRLTLDTSVGSCTTLIAERLFYIYAEHHVSDEILLLIYGTVLLDTICLSEKAKRFTRRDVYLLRKLDALLGNKRPIRDELYKQLVEMKNSTRDLNFEKLMKRDLKVYKDRHGLRVGIASLFGMAAKEALGLAANTDLDQFFRQNQYEAFIIMGLIADLDHSDSISRDLVLISAHKRLYDDLCKAFESDTSKLDLIPIGSNSNPDPEDNIINNKRIVDSNSIDGCSSGSLYKARIWLQRNVTSSRKVVAPLVLKVLHDSA